MDLKGNEFIALALLEFDLRVDLLLHGTAAFSE